MWEEKDNQLCRTFVFEDFVQAFGFMARASLICERMNHHPTWTNTYNKVEVKLTTHDVGNRVTEKDHLLAKAMDELL